MPARCNQCGLVAPDDRLMHKYWHGPTGDPQLFCPACWSKRQEHTEKLEARFVVAMVLVIAGAAALAPAEHGGAIGRLALGIVIIEALSVVLHEMGHAAGARLMGLRVYKFSVGMGRNLFRRRLGQTEVEFNLLPVCGYVRTGNWSTTFGRSRYLVLVAAGPATNIALAALGFAMVGGDWAIGARGPAAVTIWHLLATINAFIAFFNLLPISLPSNDDTLGPMTEPTDGMLLLSIATARGAHFRQWLALSVQYQVTDRLRAGDDAAALEAARRGVATFPQEPLLAVVLADALAQTGKTDEARSELDALLARDSLDASTRAMAELGLANLILDTATPATPTDTAAIAEADRLTDRLMRQIGDHPSVRLARGRTLIATGWIDKGVKMLNQLLGERLGPPFAAECACAMAHAELAQNDRDRARHYRDLARSLDDKCKHLPGLDRSLAVS